MYLSIDIGNSTTSFAVVDRLTSLFRSSSNNSQISSNDNQLNYLRQLTQEYDFRAINKIAISSVVPELNNLTISAVKTVFNLTPLLISSIKNSLIKNSVKNPETLGVDRFAGANAAYKLYGAPIIIIDLGTATTINLVSASKNFIGGVITTGFKTYCNSLINSTSQLPQIEFTESAPFIGNCTFSSLKSGLFNGYIGAIKYLIEGIKKEQPEFSSAKIITTGGMASLLKDSISKSNIYNPNLVNIGTAILAELNDK